MNVDQIANGEKRIFPYYKGEYMGLTPIGYSSIKSAMKYMQLIPQEDIYDECFGGEKQFMIDYGYFNKLSDSYYSRYGLKVYKIDPMEKVFAKKMSEDELNVIVEELKNIADFNNFTKKDDVERIVEFEEKYNLYPSFYRDYNVFQKAYNKYKKEKVEYREGILDINVKWNDGTITKAPFIN